MRTGYYVITGVNRPNNTYDYCEDLHLYVISAGQSNSQAHNMTSWLKNETQTIVDYDTYSNFSGIVLARSIGGVTITVTGNMYQYKCILRFAC